MTEHLIMAAIMLIPLTVGGILHMVVVRFDLLPFLKIPISLQRFGKNKTWRGFIAMPLLTIPGVYLAGTLSSSFYLFSPILIGLLLGLGYVIFELPNSYIKRRIGISEGEVGGKMSLLQVIVDQADSGIGCIIVYYFFLNIPIITCLMFLFIGTFIHLFFNFTLFCVGLRKRPI